MRVYQTNEIKNIALLGSAGSGKTTLAESMLFGAGIIKRRGTVEAKNTVCDYFPVEQEYGYSVFSTVFHVEWNNKKLNIIDCPGSDDFVGGAITALNVTDQAVILINGQYGPEVGTQNNFRYTEKLKKPVIFLVNQLDSDKCDFDNVMNSMKEIYGSKCVQIQYPTATGAGFNSIIDVLLMKKYSWKPEGGAPIIEEIPAEEMDKAMELHKALVEAAAENDETLMEKFFETEALTEDEMREGIRKGLVARSIFPVFCVCAGKDMGVRRLMEFLGNVVPFVSEMDKIHNTRGEEVTPDPNGAESVYFFKTAVEPHIGEVSYFKVMSGSIKVGDDLTNADRGSKERIGQLFACAGANRIPVEQLNAGDIGCTVKLKDVKTGNTLNGKGVEQHFDFIKYPNPKYMRAIEAVNSQETEKLMAALLKMRQEDPTWIIEQSKELRQTIVKGQGEFHLRTLKWRLENNEKLQTVFKEARIPYRETITKQAKAEYRHKKQSGGAGQFGEVHLIVEPYAEGMPDPTMYKFNGQEFKMNIKGKEEKTMPWGGKLVFINSVVGGAIDTRFMPAILKGIMDCMERGPLTGSYARDVRVVVYDGKMHPVDSNELSFTLAARHAFSDAFKIAGPKILEPIYDLEVYVPGDYMGDVMSDLQGRRAMIMGMDSEAGYQKLQAKIPLKELASYSISLSSLTGGRASFTTKFSSYELVPNELQQTLIAEHEAEVKDEEE
ncbi:MULTISPECIES: elongation factor G [Bacteroidales]|jgi:putative translation elongation factor G|uniref:Elongation factor G n=2 Tax=Prevotella intermedia TaxID=28131 RepID=A0A0S3UIJ5_PREIN|nr:MULTISPECIES: elongation factor G [Bacteroidales]APW32479.1 elongation factor G [Prevotella intermedia ATCC 25611 = DSM 20706]ATV25813.1 elongation factor G [Prevotella intermedia]ATV27977.1 elongation factor G [Prevotella intermedia]ATV31448.1 elongation factor G [Prevotella intermedia]ATV33513.1 elongation factor G [Prevotella intermedia]